MRKKELMLLYARKGFSAGAVSINGNNLLTTISIDIIEEKKYRLHIFALMRVKILQFTVPLLFLWVKDERVRWVSPRMTDDLSITSPSINGYPRLI
ncbi:MAG: hypothetical protein OEW95_02635 [Candidatus Bathyarchaeota archaeon]|nr:hypothetical protein [Candidatus Bathyarchaeota archaeon]